MPLRSVEAATRDDAIAAAREQFGPSARVVGVRRVRSGGVLGFFATERYVAEVAADPFARPELTAPGSDTPSALETTGRFASPLSGAAAATAAPSVAGGTRRAPAPARNGAAAYAAAAGKELPDRSPEARGTARSAEPFARTAEPAAPAPRSLPHEDDAVSELAGLFADAPAEPPVGLYGPGSRVATPRGAAGSRDGVLPRADVDETRTPTGRIGLAAALDPAAYTPDAPSPFTAALARMAAGDRDVRDAVEVALDQPRVVRGRSSAGARPSWSPSQRLEDTSAPSFSTRQEEEPVGEQVVAPPSTDVPPARELPNWAAEPAPAIGSPREEAIAEVLRSALAQGHSDEALAGILRKMLAGASPQTALAEPAGGSLFQAAPAPAPAVPQVAPMSLAMALASAGSAVQPAEGGAPVPVLDTVLETVVPDVAAVAEPSMFEATGETVPDVVAEVAPEPMEEAADVQPGELETGADAGEVTDSEMAEYETPEQQASEHQASEHQASEHQASEHQVPAYEAVAYEPPSYEPPAYRVPSYRSPAYESPLFDSPLFARPVADNSSMWGPSVASIWGEPTSSHVPLWGEPAPFGHSPSYDSSSYPAPAYQADVPIWDDVVSGVRSEQAAAPEIDVFEAAVFKADVFVDADPVTTPEPPAEQMLVEDVPAEVTADEVLADEVTAQEVTAASEDDVLDSALPEPETAVLAPVFARTASDPAPLSLDATTVMPPLSLLPPLPGSRGGRGRPPVPPSAPRSSNRSMGFSAGRSSMPGISVPADRDVPASTGVAAPRQTSAVDAAAPVAPETGPDTVQSDHVVVNTSAGTEDVAELPVETASMRAIDKRAPKPAGPGLATVTRLPVATLAETPQLPEIDLFEELDAPAAPVAEEPVADEPAPDEAAVPVADMSAEPEPPTESGTVAALGRLGLPDAVLGADFAADAATIGTYAALTRSLSLRLPAVPDLPIGAGEVLFVVGPGVETLRAARTLAAGLRLDPESVQWATRGDLAGLAPRESRMTTVEAARQRRQSTADAGTVTIVAVDVPLRTDTSWMEQLRAIWAPVAVWAVVEATRKPEDLDRWLAALTTVDALIVTDTDLSGEPAAALRTGTPVAVVDGARATPHRWASLLCERLETRRA